MTNKAKQINFEKALQELNVIVEKIERGDLELEQSLAEYEKGIKLIRDCQNALKEAEQKIQILTERKNQPELKPYEPTEET